MSARVSVSFFCVIGAFMGLGNKVWVLGVSVLFCSEWWCLFQCYFSGCFEFSDDKFFN